MWLPHLVALNSFGWCKPCRTFKSLVQHLSPSYVIIQVQSAFQRTQSCIQKPSTYQSSITFSGNKCRNKRSNWSMFLLRNKLLIFSPTTAQGDIWIPQIEAGGSWCIILLLNLVYFREKWVYASCLRKIRVHTLVCAEVVAYMEAWWISVGTGSGCR